MPDQSVLTVVSNPAAAPIGLRTGIVNGAASISNTSPDCVWTPSLNDSVAVPKKWTWTSPGRRKPGYLKRSEEHTSELQSLMRISYAVFCLKKKTNGPTCTENDSSNLYNQDTQSHFE